MKVSFLYSENNTSFRNKTLSKPTKKYISQCANNVANNASTHPTINFGQICTPPGGTTKIKKFNLTNMDKRLKMLVVEKWENSIVYPEENLNYPKNYIYVDKNNQTRLLPHLYIQGIEVKKQFRHQGVCAEIERKIVELSRQIGCEGRVRLFADYMLKDRTPFPPSIAHYKTGFRFPVESQNTQMEEVLRGELPIEEAPLGTMYYPI